MLYMVEYWCSARGWWRAASFEDGRPMEFESVDTAILEAFRIAHAGRRTRVTDSRGNFIREFG